MPECCGKSDGDDRAANPAADDPCAWFDHMLDRCYEYAVAEKAAGRPVVGILCEYTPRELIMAAGAVPVCLCGGSAKTIPAAEEHLPANLCPLIKSTYGYHLLRSNPFLEMADLVVGETTCDGKKKMYELMSESRPMYVIELPHKADHPDSFEYWLRELEDLRTFLSQRFAVDVTDDKLRAAIVALNRERALRRGVAALMKADRPPLSGRRVLDCKCSIWAMPAALEQYQRVLEALGDGGHRIPAAPQCGPGGGNGAEPVRVLMTGVPMVHGAERVLDIIESGGGLVVAMENCTGLKPLLEDVDETAANPLRAIAEKYFHLPCSVMTPNDRRLESLRRLAAEYRPECVVELTWQACLTYDVEAHRVKRFVEQELRLPYLHIETDYSPSDSPRIATRVEALLETVCDRRSTAACNRP
jgi:benzoyl-CoA reductase/2-hydroxyglutaryl-CoA dehydratase subunit BcrC/BadD/HgdB